MDQQDPSSQVLYYHPGITLIKVTTKYDLRRGNKNIGREVIVRTEQTLHASMMISVVFKLLFMVLFWKSLIFK